MPQDSRLNPGQRATHLARMKESSLDVLVIGGGVTGCGVALDAASRGLAVGLVEQRDFASGTSSRSSKLFHGGLRYLEQRNFSLVREALAERNLMVTRLCPHLVEPVSFLYPLTHRFWERAYVGAGVLLYEALGAGSGHPLPRSSHLGKTAALELAPSLEPDSLIGAIRYWDATVDDARHTMTLARTAAAHGAFVATSTRVVGLTTSEGRVSGAEVIDLETGDAFNIGARTVISAAGVWTDDIQELAGDEGLDVQASKGVHLVVPRSAIRSDTGLILRTESSVLFAIPWNAFWIIGTTDTPWHLRRAHPAASRSDINYLLDRVNQVLAPPVRFADVVGVYAGLRPLLVGESSETSRLIRDHAVIVGHTGLVSIAGGKYTTYRIMARDAVDVAASQLEGDIPASTTHEIRLVGEDRPADLSAMRDADPVLGAPLGESRYSRSEAVYAVTHEGALHLDDVLTRRTRISIETPDRGVEVALDTASLMASVLGWDPATIKREVDHYRARVRAELDSQTRPDDETADAARMGAADVRLGAN